MAELNDSIMLKVNSGMANLDLPKDASFTLNGEVGSGIFSCDFPLNNRQDNEKVVKGTHGSGEYKIDAKVSSGKLKNLLVVRLKILYKKIGLLSRD